MSRFWWPRSVHAKSRSRKGDRSPGARPRLSRRLQLEWLEDRTLPSVLTVTNTADSGPGSLRQAILDSNASVGVKDTITFSIGSGVKTIAPLSALPTITDPVVIDGTSQPGYSGTPVVQVDGDSGNVFANGLTITAGNSTVKGLAITGFRGGSSAGIYLSTNGGNVVQGNYIGTNPAGTALGQPIGVYISGVSANTVGGTDPGTGNVISGNANSGVYITGSGATGNLVQGNYLGTTKDSTAALGNGTGVYITSAASNTLVGGTAAGAGNLISGNGTGISISGGATGTLVQGNLIGTNAAGTAALNTQLIGVDIEGASSNTVGGTAAGAGNLISGNTHNFTTGYGIYISGGGATGNLVQGNRIGTTKDGTAALGNSYGVFITGAPSNTVGGTAAGAGNLISGNDFGIAISSTGATGNLVQGNYIGTNAAGSGAVGNINYGVYITSAASNTVVGGTAAGAGNLISGNGTGIYILGSGATGNVVAGNYIGTNAAGTAALGNTSSGVVIDSAASNTVGGTAAGAGNTISGSGYGVVIEGSGATGDLVQGNRIGTNATGTAALGNTYGVYIASSNLVVGGTAAGAGNLISGNSTGVYISSGVTGTLVQGNRIGTNAAGTAALGNTGTGVTISQGSNNTVGGTAAGAANLISGNGTGVYITDIATTGSNPATGNVVQGNYIGTNAAGSAALGNSLYGVRIDTPSNTVGGTAAGAGNLISANTRIGVYIYGGTGSLVQGNRIGTDASGTAALGNGTGVYIGSSSNTVGGTAAGAGNTIAFSQNAGVAVVPGSDSGVRNAILGNAVYGNGGLGIDLNNDGVTPNDPGDPDTGPNNLQNFPVLSTPYSTPGTLTGTLNSSANTTFRLEFFANAAADPSGYGEGQTFLGSLAVTTDSAGNASFTFSYTPVAGQPVLTATATDPAGNTSEFSGVAKSSTTTSVSSSASPSAYGQAVTLTAAVAPPASGLGTPTGTVTFKDGGTTLGSGALNGSGVASLTTSALAPGGHSITAVYGGDASFAGSTSAALTQTVNQAATTTVVTASANPSVAGQAVTFTATVTANSPSTATPTGSVQFQIDGANFGTAVALNASGQATSGSTTTLAVGSHTVTALFTDGASFQNSSGSMTQVVQPTVLTVTNTADSGPGSLRQAILDSNASVGGRNTIAFSIGTGVQTIAPLSALPTITDPVVIDGTTQPGYSGTPLVQLDGNSAGSNVNGLTITAGNSTVRGLVISDFGSISSAGIYLSTNGGNLVQGNYIGTNPAGTAALGNGYGVYIASASNTVGGTAGGAGNLISGNSTGIEIAGSGATGNLLQGNKIGTDVSGTKALGNSSAGVEIDGQSNTVGGTAAGAGNLISGNSGGYGIFLAGSGATGNLVQGNLIGTDINGTKALGNFTGIFLVSASSNTVGGTAAGAGNLISGNGYIGIDIFNGTTGTLVQGNYIGTTKDGSAALANSYGVFLNWGSNTVGGTAAGAGNLISGNNYAGIYIASSGATGSLVQGNKIGTNAAGTAALGNGIGVQIDRSPSNTVGGTAAGAGNTIAFSRQAGVTVLGSAAVQNGILGNAVYGNGGLGIDLNNDGVTPNDPGDPDTGPNNLQNYPVLSPYGTPGTLAGTLNSSANTTFRLEFFANAAADPSGYGEGQTFLGSLAVTTDSAGNASFTFSYSPVAGQPVLTATATDPAGNTSEFSAVAQPGTATSVSSSANPSTYGQAVTLTAAVASAVSGLGTPTGTVTFKDGGATLGTGTLNGSGVATLTTSALAAGSHSITAVYNGDATFAGSTSAALTQTVNPASTSTTVTVDSAPNPSLFGQQVTFTATVSPVAPGTGTPTGTVTFTIDGAAQAPVTLSGGQATLSTALLGVGSHTVSAAYAGDAGFTASSGTLSGGQTVNKAGTTTAVSSSAAGTVSGQAVTFTATVSVAAPGSTAAASPTGTVTFYDNGVSLGTGALGTTGGVTTATLTTSALTTASHSITAAYTSGDGNFLASGPSAAITQTVSAASTTTAVSSSATNNTSTYGQSVIFTAAVTVTGPGSTAVASPTGTVIFYDNGTQIGTGSLSTSGGSTTASFTTSALAAGSHPITVSYAGDGNFNGSSTATALTQTVNKATLTVTADSKSRLYGDPDPAFTATITGFQNSETLATSGVTGSAAFNSNDTATSPVGTYSITAAQGSLAAGNYSFAFANGTLTVNKAHLTVTADSQSRLYGDANPALTYTLSGFKNGETPATAGVSGSPTLSTTATAASAVGGYAIAVADAGTLSAANYDFPTLVAGTLTVSKATLTVTANDASRTYGDANPAFTASYSGFKNGETLATSGVTGSPGLGTSATAASAVGGYAITASAGTLAASNYSFAFANGTLTVTQRAVTATADPKSKTYGDADPALTYAITAGNLVNGDSFSGALTRAAGENVGSYAIQQGTLALSGNYALTYVGANLTITKATLTVTADDKSRAYGDANPAFTASYAGFKNGETLATSGVTGSPGLSTVATATSAVGTYAITASAGTLAAGNYAFAFANGTLAVNKATLTVTADNQSRLYGDANPSFTARYSGFKNGETLATSRVTGSPGLGTSATAASAVGTYAITASAGTLAASNYAFAFANGTLAVNKATLTVTADSQSRLYGDANPALTASYAGFKNGETLATSGVTGSPGLTTSATASSPVGTYTITASQGSLAAGNYQFSYVAGTLTVNKATLSVTADNQSRLYGDANPSFTANYSGFKNNETLATSGVSGSPGLGTSATAASAVGTYAITAAAGTLAASNYQFSFTSGTLTVNKAHLTVTANDASRLYGDPNPGFSATLSGFKNGETLATSGVTGSASLGTTATATSPVGTYAITASQGTLAATNYDFTPFVSGTLTVNKATLTVTANNTSRQYSDPNPTFTAGYSGFKNGETLATSGVSGSPTLSTTATAASPVGSYAITAAQGSLAAGNYSFAFANGALAVTQEDARATYNGDLLVFTSSTSSTSATVTLRATLQDITAVPSDPAYDPNAGDIRNATVTFVNRDTGAKLGTVGFGTSSPVVLVNPTDTKTGTVSLSWNATISGGTSQQFTIGIIVGQDSSGKSAGYYTRNSSAEDTVVTVSQPYGTGFITGGGYLVTQSSSAGLYAGTAGTKNNFGFNVKFNNSGTNLQGNFNSIIRQGSRVYQIKSNSISSLAISGASQNQATFSAKANLQDITDPNNVISIAGNLSLQVTMTDNGDPGSWTTPDTIGITLWNGSALWFSSNWSGTKTVEQGLGSGNGGGNVVVHHAQMVAGGAFGGPPSSQVLTRQDLQPIVAEAVARWQAAGLPPAGLALLKATDIEVADLPGAYVGRESANGVILIDPNAAGYGWFVDPTPADDSEFPATANSPAAGHLDLLTVVAHELGHVVGLAESADPRDVMFEDLAPGVRKVPDAADVREAGYQPVVSPGQAAAQSVVAASPAGQPAVSPVYRPDVAARGQAVPAVPALDPGVVDVLVASLAGNSGAPPVSRPAPTLAAGTLQPPAPLPTGNENPLRPAAAGVLNRGAGSRTAAWPGDLRPGSPDLIDRLFSEPAGG